MRSATSAHEPLISVVVDHDQRRLVWAAPGGDKAILSARRRPPRTGTVRANTRVSADAADWIATVVAKRCPNAVRCADPLHVVAWATEALDEERRHAWKARRRAMLPGIGPRTPPATRRSSSTPGMRSGRTEDLNVHQQASPPRSPRPTGGCTAPTCSRKACGTCARSRARKAPLAELGATLLHPVVRQARPTGSVSTPPPSTPAASTARATPHREHPVPQIRLLTRIAFGFNSPEALVALAMLSLGGHRSSLLAEPPTDQSE